jgi:hypothetical protein
MFDEQLAELTFIHVHPMPLASTPIDYPCMITIESSLYILNPCDA